MFPRWSLFPNEADHQLVLLWFKWLCVQNTFMAEKCHWEPCKYPRFVWKAKTSCYRWLWWEWLDCSEGFVLCTNRCQGSGLLRTEGTPWLPASVGGLEALRSRRCSLATGKVGDSWQRILILSTNRFSFVLYYYTWVGLTTARVKNALVQTNMCGVWAGRTKGASVTIVFMWECWSCLWKGSQRNIYFWKHLSPILSSYPSNKKCYLLML